MNLSGAALHRIILRAALTSAHLFAWVFIFQYFYVQQRSISRAFVSVLLTYALSQILVILLTPISARRLKHGFRRTLTAATLALAAAFAALGAAFAGALGDIAFGITIFAVLTGLYRAFYWIPYEVSRTSVPQKHREWIEIGIALMPLFAGLYLTSGVASAVALLYVAAIAAALAVIPVYSLKDVYEGYSWTYRQTFHELFDIRYRSVLWSSMLSGIESATLFILWPIAVFTLLDWSYPLLGVVMSLTLLFTLVARKLFGGAIESVPHRVQPILAASGWIMRLGVGGFVGAVLIDTYFHTASRSNVRGIDVGAQEHVADNHTFVDEHTALKEMGMALGRILMCLLAVTLLNVLQLAHALALAFLAAALAAGFSVYLATKPRHLF